MPQRTPPLGVAAPQADYAAAAHRAYSPNTRRALRADLAVFGSWCAGRGLHAMPARPETVAAFVDAMAETRAPATVRRYVASIAAAHRTAGHGEGNAHPLVSLALRRLHRSRGRRQAQAYGLTWRLRQRLFAAGGERLIDDRNRALVAVAYDGMLRRSELTALAVADIVPVAGGGATLLVRRGKTDAEGRGQTVYVARDSLSLVRQWLGRGQVTGGRLFRSVHKGGAVGQSLDPSQVPRIIKAMARRAGLPDDVVDGLSGHSPRIGAAQDMVARGIELPAILQAGRWKTTAMVFRYGEHLRASSGAAARLARLQRRG